MATTLLGQKSLSASIEQSVAGGFNQTGTYRRTYLVEADNECNDEYSVLFGTPGLPIINERSDVYPALRVSSRSASEIAPRFWEVTVVWTLPEPPQDGGGGGSGGGGGKSFGSDWGGGPAAKEEDKREEPPLDKEKEKEDPDVEPKEKPPWERPARLSISSVTKKKRINHAYYFGWSENGDIPSEVPGTFIWTKDENKYYPDDSGFPQISFTNSAGQSYHIDQDYHVFQMTNEFSRKFFDSTYYFNRLGSVNRNEYEFGPAGNKFVFKPLSLLLSSISVSEDYWSNPDTGELEGYWNISLTIEYDIHQHCLMVADIGTKYFVWEESGVHSGTGNCRHYNAPESTARTYLNSDQEPSEGALNGKGGLDENGRINHLFYMPHKIMIW